MLPHRVSPAPIKGGDNQELISATSSVVPPGVFHAAKCCRGRNNSGCAPAAEPRNKTRLSKQHHVRVGGIHKTCEKSCCTASFGRTAIKAILTHPANTHLHPPSADILAVTASYVILSIFVALTLILKRNE